MGQLNFTMRNKVLHIDFPAEHHVHFRTTAKGGIMSSMQAEAGPQSWGLAEGRKDPTEPDQGDRKFVAALARGLEVLRAFTPSEGILGNRDIAQRTGLPKPTVSRLTYTLTKLGYLSHIDRIGKYQLAPGALAIG